MLVCHLQPRLLHSLCRGANTAKLLCAAPVRTLFPSSGNKMLKKLSKAVQEYKEGRASADTDRATGDAQEPEQDAPNVGTSEGSIIGKIRKGIDNLKESRETAAAAKAKANAEAKESLAAAAPKAGARVDSRSAVLNLCGFDIEGVSIAGQETCIILPRFKVVLDVGRCPQRSVYQQHVLISHGHLDHIGGLPFHATTR